MAADALTPYITNALVSVALTMQDKRIFVIHEEGFKLPVQFKSLWIIENVKIFSIFINECSMTSVKTPKIKIAWMHVKTTSVNSSKYLHKISSCYEVNHDFILSVSSISIAYTISQYLCHTKFIISLSHVWFLLYILYRLLDMFDCRPISSVINCFSYPTNSYAWMLWNAVVIAWLGLDEDWLFFPHCYSFWITRIWSWKCCCLAVTLNTCWVLVVKSMPKVDNYE